MIGARKMRILNLYAGIGGNRRLWGDNHEITAVEYDPKIATVYSHYFPNDTMVVGDAHQYLLDHHNEFDLVWASPPCPSHSTLNFTLNSVGNVRYPDMALYEEIIYLQHFHKGLYLVENVISYYSPLIQPQVRGRHYFWANFKMPEVKIHKNGIKVSDSTISEFEQELGYDLSAFDLDDKRKVLRNCVVPTLGLAILNAALGKKQAHDVDQLELLL